MLKRLNDYFGIESVGDGIWFYGTIAYGFIVTTALYIIVN